MDRKVQNKKDRAKEVRKKVLNRRKRIRAEAKEERQKVLEEKRMAATVNRYTRTIRRDEEPRKTEEEIQEQLRHNMQILKALEKEYDGLIKSREEYADRARQQQQEEGNFGGSAGVEFVPFHTEQDKQEYENKNKSKS
jgi:Icc-related predicted phosphoesterase